MNSVNQTIQRAAMAAETAATQQRPTQQQRPTPQQKPTPQQGVLTNAAKYTSKEVTNHVEPVHEVRNQEVQAQKTPIPKVPFAESETAQGDMLMQEIQDLMVKGYDGKLTFERDFVSEGLEMLNSIQN